MFEVLKSLFLIFVELAADILFFPGISIFVEGDQIKVIKAINKIRVNVGQSGY
jgi:hypothetical protein